MPQRESVGSKQTRVSVWESSGTFWDGTGFPAVRREGSLFKEVKILKGVMTFDSAGLGFLCHT